MDICVQQFQYQRYLVSGGRPPALRLTRCHFQASSTETSISSAWQMVQTERFCPHRGFRRRLYLAWKLYPSHLLTKSLHGLGRGQANLYVQTHTATALTRGWLLRLVALCCIQEFGSGKEMVTGWFSFVFLQTAATYSRCFSLYFGVAVMYVQPAFCFVYTAFLLQESIWWGPDRCICLWAAGQ